MARPPIQRLPILLGLTGVWLLSGCSIARQSTGDPASRAGPRWFKGNTHTHSLWSDGNDFPEMVVDWYRQRDYDFLGLSDHNILSAAEKWKSVAAVISRAGGDDVMSKYIARFGESWVLRRNVTTEEGTRIDVRLRTLEEFRPKFEKKGEFILIQAEEITDRFERHQIHINAVGLAELIRPQRGTSVRDTIRNNLRAVKQQEQRLGTPIIAHLNHPNFGFSVTAEDLAHVLEEEFFEVYNGHPGINHTGDDLHAGDERIWDIANTIRLGELNARPLYGVATDDSHNYHGRGNVTPGRGWIMVRADRLEKDAIIEAMQRGAFYASSGVTLKDVRFEAGRLDIEIDARPGVQYVTEFIGTRTGYDITSTPVLDEQGQEVDTTRRYSSDIGEVLATSRGRKASYTFKGDELYVRATITSSEDPLNPSYEGQKQQAWVQPVGWKKHVNK